MKRLMFAAAALLTGCTHLNGFIDAGDEFGCGVAPGVRCAALSENFERQERAFAQEADVPVAEKDPVSPADGKSQANPPPNNARLRNPPRKRSHWTRNTRNLKRPFTNRGALPKS